MIYLKSNYTAPLDYIISSYIREYDISKANINILLYKGLISKNEFDRYYNMHRMERQIKIGLLQRDNKEIREAVTNGFKEIMELFFKSNNIQDHEVLAIKKDAIYLINKIPTNTTFNNIEFVHKNIYTSFYKIKRLEFYYFGDSAFNKEYLDVKGINDEILKLHEKYFLEFLLVLLSSAQTDPIEEVINIIQLFYNKYINLELDIGYYRNFDNRSNYLIKTSTMSKFEAEHLPEDRKSFIDISYNANLIREFYKIFSTIYFQNKK